MQFSSFRAKLGARPGAAGAGQAAAGSCVGAQGAGGRGGHKTGITLPATASNFDVKF